MRRDRRGRHLADRVADAQLVWRYGCCRKRQTGGRTRGGWRPRRRRGLAPGHRGDWAAREHNASGIGALMTIAILALTPREPQTGRRRGRGQPFMALAPY